MNFLAHLLFAEDSAESYIGNLYPDFARVPEGAVLPPALAAGIVRHRRVDQFTDEHPLVLRGLARLRPRHRHCAGIVADLFYDHFLSVHWARYSPTPLAEFTGRVYSAFERRLDLCPEALRRIVPKMRAENWLMSYGTVDGVAFALERISRRLQREAHLETAREELLAHYGRFEAEFLEFFPLLQTHLKNDPDGTQITSSSSI